MSTSKQNTSKGSSVSKKPRSKSAPASKNSSSKAALASKNSSSKPAPATQKNTSSKPAHTSKKSRSKATPARMIAREVLAKTRVRQAYVREILNTKRENLLRANKDFDQREFDFAQVLCFGVVATYGTLDEFIDDNLSFMGEVNAKLRDCLRISAYELLFLEHEAYVVVDQGVELVKSINSRAAGFANVVLRKMAESAQDFFAGDSMRAMARKVGMQAWVCAYLIDVYGKDRAEQSLKDMLLPAPTYIVQAPKNTFAADLAAQFIASLVPLQGTILEVGAGRGTKTALLQLRALQELGTPANIYALDVHEYKAKILQERLVELGLPEVKTITADGRKAHELCQNGELPQSFDCVFVDAPCTGAGTFRRHPEGRWRLSAFTIGDLAQLQCELLLSAALCVKVGGVIVYSTCSILPDENKNQIQRFLDFNGEGDKHPDPDEKHLTSDGKRLVANSEYFTANGSKFELQAIERELTEENWHYIDGGMFQSLPAKNLSDGHFAAILKRIS